MKTVYLQMQKVPSKKEMQKRREDSERVRNNLIKKYKSPDRWKDMTFKEQRELLKRLFDGHDPWGKPYGVHMDKEGIVTLANVLGAETPGVIDDDRPDYIEWPPPDYKYKNENKTKAQNNSKGSQDGNNYKSNINPFVNNLI